MPYLKSRSDSILLVTLATLADLVDDSEAKHLETNRDLFKFLLKCLTYSLNDRHRRCEGWSAMELTRSNYNLQIISGLFYSWQYMARDKTVLQRVFTRYQFRITYVTYCRFVFLPSSQIVHH